MTLSTPDASVFSATECLPFDVQVTCDGVPTSSPVVLDSLHHPELTPAPGSFFATTNCQGPATSVTVPGQRSFMVATMGAGAVAGDWELRASASGASTASTLTFAAKMEAPSRTQLVLDACTPLLPPRLVGLRDSLPAVLMAPLQFNLSTLPTGTTTCASTNATFMLQTQQSRASQMPSLIASRYQPGSLSIASMPATAVSLNLFVAFDVETCAADGGVRRQASECCQPGGATAVDGGYQCP